MAKPKLKVLYLSYEAYPFLKIGGLGDVASALPRALKKIGVDIRLVLPKFPQIKKVTKIPLYISEMKVERGLGRNSRVKNFGPKVKTVDIFKAKLPQTEVPVYFIESRDYFERKEIFGYPDDLARFIFFCQAALAMIKTIGWRCQILHGNDWQAAAIPLLLKRIKATDPFYQDMKFLYTIHNLGYQGTGSLNLEQIGLEKTFFKYKKGVNLMAEGILGADLVNTVSPSYAKEILTPEFGAGLEKLLRKRKNKLSGIINGLDYQIFSPQSDKALKVPYSRFSLNKKLINKLYLQKISHLAPEKNVFLLGMVSRLAAQKGLDIIRPIIKQLAELPLQIIFLGTGQREYEKMFLAASQRYPRKIAGYLKFDSKLARQIYAGADAFLMPSYYEPCGLGQLMAMAYGTVPIVRGTGGLKDTIIPFSNDSVKNSQKIKATGFVFQKYTSRELLKTIQKALKIYYDNKEAWQDLQMNGLKQDFSWETSAKEYLRLYRKLLR